MEKRKYIESKKFNKKLKRIQGKELENVITKIDEILFSQDLSHYKNLKYGLKNFKRVHVNTHFVIIFFDDKNNIVYFIDYDHHDKIYNNDYTNIAFKK